MLWAHSPGFVHLEGDEAERNAVAMSVTMVITVTVSYLVEPGASLVRYISVLRATKKKKTRPSICSKVHPDCRDVKVHLKSLKLGESRDG